MSMKSNLNVSIKTPCSANWQEMIPNQKGRFCGECKLTVVDFTQMNELEIKEYFKNTIEKKTCGRFNPIQLSSQKVETRRFWKILTNKVELNFHQKYLKTLLLFGLTVLAFLSSCGRSSHPPIVGDVDVMGEPTQIEKKDTISVIQAPKMGKVRIK